MVALAAYAVYFAVQLTLSYRQASRDIDTIRQLVTSEELLLQLTPDLKTLELGVLNLNLPGLAGLPLIESQVDVVDLAPDAAPEMTREAPSISAQVFQWPVERKGSRHAATELALWRPLLSQVDYFEHAGFYFVDGTFSNERFDTFDTLVGFKALARTRTDQWNGVRAKLRIGWKRMAKTHSSEQSLWRIVSWETKSLETVCTDRLLFVEALDRALPGEHDLRRARQSLHQQQVVEYYKSGAKTLPSRYFSPISANLKPGLSVVDVDNDGLDDLYVTDRVGRNQLLRNQGDGTFKEEAARFGLDIDGHSTSAIFADFDNDGDADLMLGRSLERSMYLENLGGRFVHRELTYAGEPLLPYLVVSMSAADYNGDGLLDVYVSTYRPAVLENIVSNEQNLRDDSGDDPHNPLDGIASQAMHWPDEFLSKRQAEEYYQRHREKAGTGTDQYNNVLDQIGPPNVLLTNLGGGRFGLAPENQQVAIWRNTLQATWGDYDEDGDPDLYVANDWALDHLFRNDGPRGFVDVTQQTGTDLFGFAMGATWGDYDVDGDQDLYVSNMYSKAGRRITARVPELNPSYARSAEGNFLYRQDGERFTLVSGLEPPALTVADAGWSWGGQFADLDNDGYLDIYVLSGYFTAPEELTTGMDL